MSNRTFVCGALIWCLLALVLALTSAPSFAQATNADFSGTYTFVLSSLNQYTVQFNMFGQQVGFCNGGQIPPGYFCSSGNLSQDVVTGTLVADGAGNVTTGSTFVYTTDPNAYKCSTKRFNATPDCPYKIPSGIAWSNTASYVVGDEVDLTVSSKTSTYQTVKNNVGVNPSTSLCSQSVQPPSCDWVQLVASATGKNSSGTGTITGKYTVQSNGSAVMTITPSGSGNGPVSFAMVVPTSPLAVGQEVPFVFLPSLSNEARGSGSAVRIK